MEIEDTAANPAEPATDARPEEQDIVSLDAPKEQAAEANTPAEGDESALDDLEELVAEPEATGPDEAEVEYEGETFKVPTKLKDAILRQADYTKKTTEVANQRRELEQQRTVISAAGSSIVETAELLGLQSEIVQLQRADISGWTAEQIERAEALLINKQNRAAALENHIMEKQTQQEQHEAAETAKRHEAAIAEASKSIPKFTDQRRTELETLAVELGIPQEFVEQIDSAAQYKILHYADIGRKFAQRQSQAAKMKAAQAGNPSARVGGVAQASKAAEDMSMEEYITARNQGLI